MANAHRMHRRTVRLADPSLRRSEPPADGRAARRDRPRRGRRRPRGSPRPCRCPARDARSPRHRAREQPAGVRRRRRRCDRTGDRQLVGARGRGCAARRRHARGRGPRAAVHDPDRAPLTVRRGAVGGGSRDPDRIFTELVEDSVRERRAAEPVSGDQRKRGCQRRFGDGEEAAGKREADGDDSAAIGIAAGSVLSGRFGARPRGALAGRRSSREA